MPIRIAESQIRDLVFTLQTLEGTLALMVGGIEHEVRAGEIIHLPAAVPHALRGGGRFKMLLTLLKKPATD